jgi:SRSO17 transposase
MELRQEQCTAPADLALAMVREWPIGLTEVERRLLPHFSRRAARRRAWAYLRGLLSPVERKNGWQLAEVNGDATPYGVPHWLGRAIGDAAAVRQDVRGSVVEHLGAPQAVLVMEETGFLKQGQHAAGVARQESGTAGRVEHCPLGVCVTSASAQGHVLLERARYLPPAWPDDVGRCERAGLPPARPLATQPQRARQLRERAFDAAVPAAWVAGESVYGANRQRRAWWEERTPASVLTVSGKE